MTYLKKLPFPFYFFVAAVVSCSSPDKKNADVPVQDSTTEATPSAKATVPAPADTFQNSVTLRSVSARQNPSLTYALYLPKQYHDTSHLSALLFFDPHGDGALPVFKYRSLAERFGVILIGSNSVRNGMTFEETTSMIQSMMEEATQRYAADPGRVSLAGFSGGAKAVLYAAPRLPWAASVIYCGAGLPPVTTTLPPALGIAGLKDMNYTEVLEMDDAIAKARQKHALVEWNGRHEWCDTSTFENAFFWMAFRAMEKKNIPVDQAMMNRYFTIHSRPLQNPLSEARRLGNLALFLEGISDVAGFRHLLEKHTGSTAYIAAEKKLQDELEVESQMKRNYFSCIETKDGKWWLEEVNRLKADQKNVSSQRLLGFISLACFSLSSQAMKQQDFAKAEKALTVYGIVDPVNVDRAYLQASFYARQRNVISAVQFLRNAVNYGFNDRNKLMQDEAFASIRNTEEFGKLLNEIKN